jgi:diguanylate cyclase (GGDEF)-like protein
MKIAINVSPKAAAIAHEMPEITPLHGKRTRARDVVNLITALGIIVVLGMLAFGIAELLEARKEAWRQAVDASYNVTLAIARDIERNVETYDLSIKGAISALRTPGFDAASPEMRQAAMFDTSATAKYLGTILILNKFGDIKWTSIPALTKATNFADRDYFGILRDHPQDGVFISRPFLSRLRNGDPSIAFVRRLNDANGNFDGIIQGAMRLAYFQELFENLNLGADGSITISRTDGYILARLPFQSKYIDQKISSNAILIVSSATSGHFQTKSVTDGIERYFTFQRVGEFPLVLINGISIDGVYSAWWEKAVRVSAILILLSAIIGALCALFRREMSRRMDAETALVEAAEKLALIANTDSLTGLANRRAFDIALEVEWRRAVRTELPVALIMIDADYFKLFNDRYGHPEGDRILKSIAGCISRATRRPADIAARYGGEEFVLILPETERAGAMMIAERIRNSVDQLKINHDRSPLKHVTVSVGVAWVIPNLEAAKENLLRDCDLALYRCKHLGRNTVCLADDLKRASVE